MGIEFWVTVFVVVLVFSHIVSWVLVYSLLFDRKKLEKEVDRWTKKYCNEKESCDVFRKEVSKAFRERDAAIDRAVAAEETVAESIEQWRESYRELDERYGELGRRHEELVADMTELANLSGEYAERVSGVVERVAEREGSDDHEA